MSLRSLGIPLVMLVGLGSTMPPPDPIPAPVKKSVNRGVAWLLAAQNRDGSWGNDRGHPGDVSNTAMAIIALMNTGSTINRGKYHLQIRRAVDWSLKRIKNGLSFGGASYQPHHTLIQRKLGPNIDVYYAALLLGQLLPLELEKHEEQFARRKLRELTQLISSFQQKNGAFEVSYEPMLTTVTAWLTLRQAHAVGIAIHGASVDKVLRYLKKECYEPKTGIFREQKWGRRERFVTQAGGLRVFYGMGQEKDADIKKASKVVLRMKFDQDVGGRAGGEEFLAALFAVQALHLGEERSFKHFYPKITKALIRCQNRDGSWTGHHCITAKVFCTACSVISMLTPNKLLPMSER
ncbi:MAG: prenyltransferase/squalene oxidase repeat-containing protein [Planctomycetota bacterium]